MMKRSILAVGAALLMGMPASAAPVTTTINFLTTNFVDTQGLTTVFPYNSVSGSFTVTFDPTLTYYSDTTDITINSFSGPPVSSPFGFTYFGSGPFAGDLFFGGTENDSDYTQIGTADFVLGLDVSNIDAPVPLNCGNPLFQCGNATGDAGVLGSGYTVVGSKSLFFEKADATTISATPEPASWAMMITGFGLVGAVLRKRNAKVGALISPLGRLSTIGAI